MATMPIELKEVKGGQILEIDLIGTLAKEDYGALVSEFQRLVHAHGKLRILLDMTDFHGWHAGAMWEEVKFDLEHRGEMELLAVVGEKRWQHAIASFAKPFTPAEIRYFDAAESAQARAWVHT
jgi:hypothetical protein